MDEQDTQDLGRPSNLKFGSITEAIIGCAFEVTNELGVELLYPRWKSSCTSCPSMFIQEPQRFIDAKRNAQKTLNACTQVN